MKLTLSGSMLAALLTAALPSAAIAQTSVFTDTFTSGSSLNSGNAPTAGSTSYDIASNKAATSGIGNNDLTMRLPSTTGGFVEAQALFTSTPVMLAATGDYIDFTMTFTDTTGIFNTGNIGSALFVGLYNSGGTAPLAVLQSSALTTSSGSPYATGGTQLWQGYVGELRSGGSLSTMFTRPQQTGNGMTSANQELLGNSISSGTFNNPGGNGIGATSASTLTLTAGEQYTLDYKLVFDAQADTITVNNNLYDGVGTGGANLSSQTGVVSGASLLATSFDGLAWGWYNKANTGEGVASTMDVNSIAVTDSLQPVPEPSTMAVVGLGAMMLFIRGFRRIGLRSE